MPRQRVVLSKDWSFDRISVRIGEENLDGSYNTMQPAVFAPHPRGAVVIEAFALEESGAQEMMNELWKLGIRPTDNTGSTGHLRAVEDHIATLKEITSKLFIELGHRNG